MIESMPEYQYIKQEMERRIQNGLLVHEDETDLEELKAGDSVNNESRAIEPAVLYINKSCARSEVVCEKNVTEIDHYGSKEKLTNMTCLDGGVSVAVEVTETAGITEIVQVDEDVRRERKQTIGSTE